ncbi:MAG: hypothetical protein K2W82_16760 [Candidatus Obscuribacterales bacterium]|nr:hypothetical protein [Candidatus Obscuribacterales bacterium]
MKPFSEALPINGILLYSEPGACGRRLGAAQKPGYALVLNHRDTERTQSIAFIPGDYAGAKAVIERLADGTPVEYSGGEKCTMFWIGSSSDSSSPTGTLSRREAREDIVKE